MFPQILWDKYGDDLTSFTIYLAFNMLTHLRKGIMNCTALVQEKILQLGEMKQRISLSEWCGGFGWFCFVLFCFPRKKAAA